MTDPFRVLVLTPYLSRRATDLFMQRDPAAQIMLYGLDPVNIDAFTEHEWESDLELTIWGETHPPTAVPDMVISGAREAGEQEVREMQGSGIVVARYSIFYGEPNLYTGASPEDAGYSLDIPKNIRSVMTLLAEPGVGRSIMDRDVAGLEDALGRVNARLSQPVLATPYLQEALSQPRPDTLAESPTRRIASPLPPYGA